MEQGLKNRGDYYPFGSVMSGREVSRDEYRFGYQGQFAEKDDETGWNAFELRMFDPAIGRWLSTDLERQFASPYLSMGNNPVSRIDLDGGFSPPSTHTDKDGNVVAVYNDGDLGVYKHTDEELAAWREEGGVLNGGKLMGRSLHIGSFADFEHYAKTGEIVAASNAQIDFSSNWAGDQIRSLLSSVSSFEDYASNAGYGEKYDIKNSLSPGGIYYGSKLHFWGGNLYVSARDAGNILAGSVAALHHIPREQAFSGFGALEFSKRFGFPGGNKVAGGLVWLFDMVYPILKTSPTRYENELSFQGITYGYDNYKVFR